MKSVELKYAVKANTHKKGVVIHKYPCGHIRKFGGVGKRGHIHWKDLEDLKQAELWADMWIKKGLPNKYCFFCFRSKF